METNVGRRNFIKYGTGLLTGWWGLVMGCQDSSRYPLPSPTVRSSKPRLSSNWESMSSISDSSRWTRNPPAVSGNEWVPPQELEDLSRWKGILIHHSATHEGNAAEFHRAHIHRGWDGLGYDFVIDNGRGGEDGCTEVGFRWRQQLTGAHCRPDPNDDNYWNEHTIGICMVGDFNDYSPTSKQWKSMLELVRFLQKRYQISDGRVIGHRDAPGAKTTCPGRCVSLHKLRAAL